jgi:hypothetical protein
LQSHQNKTKIKPTEFGNHRHLPNSNALWQNERQFAQVPTDVLDLRGEVGVIQAWDGAR